jgi:hypothetical protein
MTVDIESSICQTYGIAKQGGRFGYTHVRGYHPLLATIAGTGEVAHSRMRGGNVGSARGANARRCRCTITAWTVGSRSATMTVWGLRRTDEPKRR